MNDSTFRASLPDRRDLRRLAFRGGVLWLGLRIAVYVLSLFLRASLGERGGPALSPPAAVLLVAIVGAGAATERWRMREGLFAANLGWHPAWPFGVAAAVAGVLELALTLALVA